MKLTLALVSLVASTLLATAATAASGYKSITPLEANDYNSNTMACCFLDWGTSGWLSQDQEFPDAQVYSVKADKMVSIHELVKDRPIVLEMGSITCPSFDLNVERMKAVAAKYKGKVDFYTVYVRENHPNEKFKTHTTMEQKIAYAKELAKESHLGESVLVDDVKGSFHQALGNFGNAVFLVGKDMRTNHWSIFANAKLLEKGIDSLLAANGIAAKAKFVGGTDIHPLAQTGFSSEEKTATLKRMSERGDKPVQLPLNKLVKATDNLNKPTKEMLAEMPAKSKDGIVNFMRTFASDAPQKDKASDRTPFLKMQESFRDEYYRRYENWKRLNKISSKENVAADQLKDPQ